MTGTGDRRYLTVTEALERCQAAGVAARVLATIELTERHRFVTVSGPARPDEVAYRWATGSRAPVAVSRRPAQIGPDTWDVDIVYQDHAVRFFLELGIPPNHVRIEFRVFDALLDGQVWPPTLVGEVEDPVRISDLEAALSAIRVP